MTVWALIPLTTCLIYIALLILTLPSVERRINKIFALYLTAAAVWSFTSFMLHLNAFPEQALFWNELLVVALVWTLITYYHFILAYTAKPAGMALYLGYGMVLLLLVFSLGGFIVRDAYVIDGVLYHDIGISLYFIGAFAYIFIVNGLYQLIKQYRSSNDWVERNRIVYLIAGWSILMLLSSTNLIMIPAIAGIPLDHIGSLINVLIIAYAIHKYQLLDLRRIMRKGLVYSGLTVSFTAMYLLLLFVLQTFFQDWMGYSSLTLAAALAFLIAVLFNPLRSLIQKWLDRLFYRETYDYRQILLSFSDKISNVLDLGELAQSILEPLVKAMHVKQVALLFPGDESNDFSTRFVQQVGKEGTLAKLKLPGDSPIVSWLSGEGKSLRREFMDNIPQLKGLWDAERAVISALEVDLFCPIRSKGSLIGILALGKKQSGSSYSDEELDLLMTMANEAAIALENARILDRLKSQQLRVEQLLTQAVLAQEDERKRISVDLHDSVAQWLVAAVYGTQTCSQVLAGNGNRNGNDEVRNELVTVENTVTKSLKELRRVVIGLRPPALDELGLSHALRQSLEDLKVDGLECTYSEVGIPLRLPSSVEIAVYRVVQEALNNIRKHADATKVDLNFECNEHRLLVEITDDGKGFDLSQTLDSAISVGHIGLLGMKQRAEMLGGDIRVKTREGMGSTVTLSLPINPRTEGG
ncbi:MAG: histidine kinase [Dehalococcoidales bacterium]|nr:histidine kinase [Dehalococcoidales bacterium]